MANTVHSLVANLRANTSSFEKGMKRAGSSLSGFGAKAKAVGGFAVKSFAVMGAAAVGAGVALSFPIKSAMKSIDAVEKMSAELEISTEALTGLEHAAKITGASLPDLHKGMQIMVRRLGEASNGTGEAVAGLKTMGLTADQLAKMNTEEQFTTLADKISKLPTVTEKAQAAYAVFGRQGMNMLNTLNLGADGLAELRAEAERLGMTFSTIDAKQVAAANDSITRLKGLLQGVVNTLTIALAPYIQLISDYFVDMGVKAGGSVEAVSSKLEHLVNILGWVVKGVSILKGVFNAVAAGIYKYVQIILSAWTKLFETLAKAAEFLKMDTIASGLKTAGTFSGAFAEGFGDLASDKWDKAGENFSKAFSDNVAEDIKKKLAENKAEIEASLQKKIPAITAIEPEETAAAKKSGKASAMEFRSRYIDVRALSGAQVMSEEAKQLKKNSEYERQTMLNTNKMLQKLDNLQLK